MGKGKNVLGGLTSGIIVQAAISAWGCHNEGYYRLLTLILTLTLTLINR